MISIIVPTATNYEGLVECLESIKKYSSTELIEVVVVANGCPRSAIDYVNSLGEPFKLHHFEDKIGYIRAINHGMKVAKGDFLLLFNDDVVLLDQDRDCWLEQLLKPFEDPRTGITGALMLNCPLTGADFIVGFCSMISRKCFDSVGYLDESFYLGGQDDIDYCIRARSAGWKVKSITEDSSLDKSGIWVSSFPLYHAGNRTFRNNPEWQKIFDSNGEILKKKYSKPTVLIHPYSSRTTKRNPKEPSPEYWDMVCMQLNNKYKLIQLGATGDRKINAHQHKWNLSRSEIEKELEGCHSFIAVDSFLPHLNDLKVKKRGIVLWSATDPNIFGYSYNYNLYLNAYNVVPWATWEYVEWKDVFVSPIEVVEALEKL